MSAPPPRHMAVSRRDAICFGLASGTAASLLVPTLLGGEAIAQEEATTDSDLEILLGLIVLEQGFVVSYGAIAERGLLGPLTPVARTFADQEREHTEALLAELAKIGGEPPREPVEEEIPGLSEVASRDAALRFAVAIENQAVAAHLDAIRSFDNPDLQIAAARIVGNEGEQLVVWRQALGAEPVPSAFPTGSEKG